MKGCNLGWKLNMIFAFVIAGIAIASIACGVYFGVRKGKVRKLTQKDIEIIIIT